MMCKHKDDDGNKLDTWIMSDARGIPCGRVCDQCVEELRKKYRPEIFTDSNYYADEPIEPEPDF